MHPGTEEKLQDVFRAIFDLPPGTDVTGLRQLGEAAWDSLAHTTLMMAIESEFGITIEAGDQIELTSYAAVRIFLEEAGR